MLKSKILIIVSILAICNFSYLASEKPIENSCFVKSSKTVSPCSAKDTVCKADQTCTVKNTNGTVVKRQNAELLVPVNDHEDQENN